MSETKDTKTKAAAAGASDTALAVASNEDIATVDASGGMELELSAEYLSELSSEIEAGLKALTIETLTPSRSLLDKNLVLVDAYMNVFSFDDQATDPFGGNRVVLEVVDDNNLTYTVAKSPKGTNLKLAEIFTAARKAQKRMIIPNVSFQERGKPKAGNMPVVLCLSKDSRPIFQ